MFPGFDFDTIFLVSAPPDPGFLYREIDDNEPVVNWSDLSDLEEEASELDDLSRNPFIDNEARECSASESEVDSEEALDFGSNLNTIVATSSTTNTPKKISYINNYESSDSDQPLPKYRRRKNILALDSDSLD